MPFLTHTFICGCGHSGTSLLANMFASHPDIFIPFAETKIFLDEESASVSWRDLEKQAEASGKPHFAEKTPRHIHYLPLIRRLVPGARFVVMVRDGRDVAASFIKRKGSATSGAKRWLEDNHSVLIEEKRGDVEILRYEDLIASPETALEGICRFVGLPFSAEMLNFHQEKRLWFGTTGLRKGTGAAGQEHRELRNWQINQPVFDGRGAWRALLSEDDLAFFERKRPQKMLKHFGYR